MRRKLGIIIGKDESRYNSDCVAGSILNGTIHPILYGFKIDKTVGY